MARRRHHRHHYRRNPDMPSLSSVEDYAWTGGGLLATQVLDEQIVLPVAQKILPSTVQPGTTEGKVADVIGTGLSAWAAWWLTRFVSKDGSRYVGIGGGTLTLLKAVAVLIPSLVINVDVPNALHLPNPFSASTTAASAKALPASASSAAPAPASTPSMAVSRTVMAI